MHRTLTVVALALAGLFACTTSATAGTTHNVRVNGDIQAAIDGASNGDTIQLAAGQYDITGQIVTNGKQVMVLGTVDGNGDPTSILDFTSGSGINCQSGTGTVTFKNLVIRNSTSYGLLIYEHAAAVIVTNCTFTDNDKSGMGIQNSSYTDPTVVTDCRFTRNNTSANAKWGGGGLVADSCQIDVIRCTFTSNLAANYGGGALYASACLITITECTFSSNSAADRGGAIRLETPYETPITDCTFTGNSTTNHLLGQGGAMFCDGNTLSLSGCIFSANEAAASGGGVHATGSTISMTQCSFSNNVAADTGGGMYTSATSYMDLDTCTFIGNSAGETGGGIYSSEDAGLTMTSCDGQQNQPNDLSFGESISVSFPATDAPVTGDADGDGDVDADDRTAVNKALGVCDADINGDGEVNGADMAFILSWWGVCSP